LAKSFDLPAHLVGCMLPIALQGFVSGLVVGRDHITEDRGDYIDRAIVVFRQFVAPPHLEIATTFAMGRHRAQADRLA
jgi:hypothetical protein